MTNSNEEGPVPKQVPFMLFSKEQEYMQSQFFKLMTSSNEEGPVHNQVLFTLFNEE